MIGKREIPIIQILGDYRRGVSACGFLHQNVRFVGSKVAQFSEERLTRPAAREKQNHFTAKLQRLLLDRKKPELQCSLT